jgi:prepilin-type processing-associated H-X9-DG protein
MSRIIPLSLLCAGLPLALTPSSPAQVPAPTPPAVVTVAAATPAVAVVRAFLADRAAGKFAAAYALLSVGLPKFMSAEQFAVGASMPVSASRQMPAQAFGMYALFADTHSTLGYTFTLVGPDPADPNSVLVRAQPRSGAVGVPAATLRLVTTADPTAHARRVDIYGSLERTAPEEFAKAQRASSQSNMKQIALGIIQYTQDNDEHLPDADKWVDEIMPYVKSEAIFRDPSAPAGEKWSYAFNRTLSRAPVAQLDSPASTVMLFESSKGTKNASDTGESVPNPGRHSGGTDYALADGHVKWLADGTKLSYTLSGK